MTLPNFFIVGAAKSGTTSLYHCLAQHPDVFMPAVKEPHYFVEWGKYVRSQAEYEALFSGWFGEKAVGEASTGYLFEYETPARIKSAIPDARIVIILRNPVEMSFALWRHMSRLGKRGDKLSFEDALKAEQTRISDPAFRASQFESWHGNFYYFNRALYYGQVKRYIDTFGKDNVLIHIFEDFRRDPLSVCRETFRFLGVDPDFRPEISAKNVGREVRHRGLYKLLNRPEGLSGKIAAMLPSSVTDYLNRLNWRPAPVLDRRLRAELFEKFGADIDMLGKLIGRDLSVWV